MLPSRWLQFVLLLLLMIGFNACKSDHSSQPLFNDRILTLRQDIATENVLMESSVGFTGAEPEQWRRYQQLSDLATDKELLALTDDTNAVVRCYAFHALLQRKHIDAFPVLLRHLSDTASVATLSGCLGGRQKVGDLYLESIHTSRPLNKTRQAMVDSKLIFGNSKLLARDALLNRLPIDEKYYNRLRELVVNENYLEALPVLAKFNRPQDLPLIKNLLQQYNTPDQYYGVAAVVNFIDPAFFPFLQQIAEQEWCNNRYDDRLLKVLYEAIAKYRNDQSRAILKKALEEVNAEAFISHADCILLAVSQYQPAVYDEIQQVISRRLMAKS